MFNFKNITFVSILLLLTYFSFTDSSFKYISGSLAIFLFGISFMDQSFKSIKSEWFFESIRKSSSNIFSASFLSFLVTSITQSGSLTILLALSLVGTGIIPLINSIGLIIGANIGATLSPWLIINIGNTFSLSEQSYFLITIGAFFFIQKTTSLKTIGGIILSIGFIFLGIGEAKDSLLALNSTNSFLITQTTPFYLFLFFIFGVISSLLIFSSNAIVILIIISYSLGQIPFEGAIVATIGANIGASITPILSSLGGNYNGTRVALLHFFLNLLAGILFLSLFSVWEKHYLRIMEHYHFSKEFNILIFHTLFNIVGSGLIIILKKPLLSFIAILVKKPKKYSVSLKFLNKNIVDNRNIFFSALSMEIMDSFKLLSGIIFKKLKGKIVEDSISIDKLTLRTETPKLFNKTLSPILMQILEVSNIAHDKYDVVSNEEVSLLIKITLSFEEISNSTNSLAKKIKTLDDDDDFANDIRYFILDYVYRINNLISILDDYESFIVDLDSIIKQAKKDFKKRSLIIRSLHIPHNKKASYIVLNNLSFNFLKQYIRLARNISKLRNTRQLEGIDKILS